MDSATGLASHFDNMLHLLSEPPYLPMWNGDMYSCPTSHFLIGSVLKLNDIMNKKAEKRINMRRWYHLWNLFLSRLQACNPLRYNSPTDIFHSRKKEPFPIRHGNGPGSPDGPHDLFQVTRRGCLEEVSGPSLINSNLAQ